MKKFFLLLLLAFSQVMFMQAQQAWNSSEILLQMKKLEVLGSVLYVAAHPDDENNSLLPYLANEKYYRTGYLSVTRGDGGQNLIGDEQGVELGLIRTHELIAARRVDGGEQYFTSAYEFGYSKSAEEALRIWDREKVLADLVWVIRQFQPDIIIKRFPTDNRAGHGHHAASAILADEAYLAAADPSKFPEQFKHGVRPWQAKRLLWNTFNFGSNNTTSSDQLKIDIGGFNSLLGKSYGEIGAEARTMHKSQGEGRPRRRGRIFEFFVTTAGAAATTSLMDGVNTSWSRIDGGHIEQKIKGLISGFDPVHPERSVPALVNIYADIMKLPTGGWRDKKAAEVQQLVEACAGLFAEAISPLQQVLPGDSIRYSISLNSRKGLPVTLRRMQFENIDSSYNLTLPDNENLLLTATAKITAAKSISQPYWLAYPLKNGMFDVRDQAMIGKATDDPSLVATIQVNISGQDFTLSRPVQYKVVDPVKGEIYQPIPVLPRVELYFEKDNYVSLNGAEIKGVRLIENTTAGKLPQPILRLPGTWSLKESKRDTISGSRGMSAVTARIDYRGTARNETGQLMASVGNGTTAYNLYRKTILYDHIPQITYFPEAKANLVRVDIKTAGKKVGFIRGAGDKLPQALEALGYQVTELGEKDMTLSYLRQFDAIVTGIRAFNIHEWLTRNNAVLNQYVASGGNMIVQYLKSNQVNGTRVKVGPYPFSVDPASRVTQEDAAVSFLLPEHPVLNYPNKISTDDFKNWVQERSTYQAVQLDNNYEAPLSMSDAGEKPSNGSLVIAKYGQGNFVYASLVFFRQLPAGVPGAYRLLANLVALPQNKTNP